MNHAEPDTGHEYDGIHEHDYPLPRWWLFTFAITVVFAVGYWVLRHTLPAAEGSFDVYGEDQAEHDRILYSATIDPAAIEKLVADQGAVSAGRALYLARCEACHGPDAAGKVGPNLTDRFWIHGGDTKSIYMTISSGYPKLGMPEWRKVLEDEQVQQLTAYLLSVRNTNVPGKAPQGDEQVGLP